MGDIILADSHGIGYAAQQGMKLTVGNRQTQAVFGSIKTMRKYADKLKATPMMLWDGHSQWRYDIFPEYKLKRKEPTAIIKAMKEGFNEQKEDIKTAFRLLGVASIIDEGSEADDLAGVLSKKLSANPDRRIWLLSRDKDWQQLVKENVTWCDFREEKYCHHSTFMDTTGFINPTAFIQGKALQGDSSDEIPGVSRIGEGTAPNVLAEYGSVPNFIKRVRAEIEAGKKVPKAYRDFALNEKSIKEDMTRIDVFKRNMRLMNLVSPEQKPQDIKIDRQKPDLPAFKEFCHELGFRSIIKDFDRFVEPFLINT